MNRAQLRAIILESADKRGALEQILHPRIRREWSAEAEKHRNSPDFFFADIPLLYETGGEPLCDRVVVVACSRDTQIERLVARGGIRAEAMKLIEAQMPLGEKITRADHVVWNNNGQEVLLGQAKRLVGVWRSESWTKK